MNYDINKLPLHNLIVKDLDENLEMINVPAPYFINEDGMLCVDCEGSAFVADYYNEMGVEFSESIEKWAKANGGYWEWVNPGCIMFVKG